ncbi:cytochrome P450 [Scenedesmus sp. NREL 46B-D3]|nr:cytochrome P450 [Scenedesmus sp. NREL 46B-D3]
MISAVDEDGNRLSEVELCDNLMLLILAGHDTSSATLTNILANLHDHPAAMQKLRHEQQALVARHGPQLSTAVLREMPYAEAVIRETLRLRNVIPGLHRVAARDIELGGYAVPAGTLLYSPLHLLTKSDPRWIDEVPEAFRPERMMTAQAHKPGWQLSFGHGPRFCSGYLVAMAEMKVLLALLARGYDMDCDTDTEWVQQVGQVPSNNLPMTLTHRSGEPGVPVCLSECRKGLLHS